MYISYILGSPTEQKKAYYKLKNNRKEFVFKMSYPLFFVGVKYVFSVKAKTLSLETSVPSEFNGTLRGLLGNFDGDMTNDYILPDETVLEYKNYTERELYYNFGQHCKFALMCIN